MRLRRAVPLICIAGGLLLATLGMNYARADVVAVVSAKSSVTALSTAQVADIFLGRASRFPNGVQAVPIDQLEDSPVRDKFYAQFTGKSPAQVKAHWSKIIFTGRGQPPKQVSSDIEARKLILAIFFSFYKRQYAPTLLLRRKRYGFDTSALGSWL